MTMAHGHAHGGDNNMRAAYVHVLADAATSVLAIVALACGYYFGLGILDPISGLVGAFVIASWAYGLIRDSAMVLLDADADPGLSDEIRDFLRERTEGAHPRPASVAAGAGPSRPDRVADLAAMPSAPKPSRPPCAAAIPTCPMSRSRSRSAPTAPERLPC